MLSISRQLLQSTSLRTIARKRLQHDLDSSGTLRNFLISIPSSYSQQSQVPIILSYHGGTRTAQYQLELDLTNPQFNTFAMVVYPQGLNDAWENIPGPSENVPDVQFTADIIDHLCDLYCIDRNRIWATGKSYGGVLCGTLACDPNRSKRIAAFAPVAGAFYVKSSTCDPSTATFLVILVAQISHSSNFTVAMTGQ
ncbi:hypothetical protein BZG36_05698 [Bifiguratus adelaidae]|uniref:feruloyl esterase n=1 Tax=Bifiguratus adelaidae TaxID=1938954 RepID=A0A261XSU9_9FUNG|nr:hypothetical protein BZG36_05698 [Bifiguratus adelaidae]